jgi:hypothetical protein
MDFALERRLALARSRKLELTLLNLEQFLRQSGSLARIPD